MGHVVAEPVQRHRGGGHRVPDDHAADRDQVPGLRLEDPERDDEAQRRHARDREGDQQRPERVRDQLRPLLRGECAEHDHDRDQQEDEPQAVLVEDEFDDVADRRQLDRGPDDSDADVLLQVGLAPERHCDRDRRRGRASRRPRRG